MTPSEKVKQRPVPGDRLWEKDLKKLLGPDFVLTCADDTKVTIDELVAAVDGPEPRRVADRGSSPAGR